jgi:hypothetical protein
MNPGVPPHCLDRGLKLKKKAQQALLSKSLHAPSLVSPKFETRKTVKIQKIVTDDLLSCYFLYSGQMPDCLFC